MNIKVIENYLLSLINELEETGASSERIKSVEDILRRVKEGELEAFSTTFLHVDED